MLNLLKTSFAQLLPEKGFARKVGLLAGGTAGAQFITLLILPLLTRLFTPEQFGVLASCVAIIAIVSMISGLRYEMAIPLATSDSQAFHLLLLSVGLVVVCAVLTTLLVMLIPANVLQLGSSKWLIPLGITGIGFYQALSYWALRRKAYKELAQTKIAQGIGRAVAQLGAGLLGAGAPGLVFGEIVGRSAGFLRLGWGERDFLRALKREASCGQLLSVAHAFRSFALLAAPASLLNSAGLQVPTLLIASLYGPVVAGWYFAAQRIVALPVQMASRAVGDTFIAEASELAKTDPRNLLNMFRKVSHGLLIIGAVPTAILILTSSWIVPWLLGPDWQTAGVFLQLLASPFLLALAYSPINFAIIGRNDYSLVWASLRLLATVGAVVASYQADFSPVGCVAVLSAAMAVTYLAERWLWNRGCANPCSFIPKEVV